VCWVVCVWFRWLLGGVAGGVVGECGGGGWRVGGGSGLVGQVRSEE
jgi:hypothetical protein